MTAPDGDRLDGFTVVVAAKELLSGEFDADAVILDLRNGVYYGLEGAGATIWKLLQRPVRLAALRDAITAQYEVDPARCESDLTELLADLLRRGLIRIANDRHAA